MVADLTRINAMMEEHIRQVTAASTGGFTGVSKPAPRVNRHFMIEDEPGS